MHITVRDLENSTTTYLNQALVVKLLAASKALSNIEEFILALDNSLSSSSQYLVCIMYMVPITLSIYLGR